MTSLIERPVFTPQLHYVNEPGTDSLAGLSAVAGNSSMLEVAQAYFT